MSQALTLFDKFKRTQESKEDKTSGPGEKEIDDLATNLQEASQGISTPADKVCVLMYLNQISVYEMRRSCVCYPMPN